jgi:hypothetical protein
MADCVFAYDEPVICPVCGGNDFALFKPLARLRCNSCKTSFTEQELVEEALGMMAEYIRNHGINERMPRPNRQDDEYFRATSTLAALVTARQLLSYPEAASPDSVIKTLKMLQAAINRESVRTEKDL